jgi:hypothetical protein
MGHGTDAAGAHAGIVTTVVQVVGTVPLGIVKPASRLAMLADFCWLAG